MDQRKAILGEPRIALPIRPPQPMLHISFALDFAQRTQMIGCRYALTQLLEPWAAECRAELGLPEQKALQRQSPVKDDVRQHAKLFECLKGQVLRLVDNQQHTPAVAMLRECELADALQQRSLTEPLFGNAETGGDHVEKVVSSKLGRHDIRGHETASVDR